MQCKTRGESGKKMRDNIFGLGTTDFVGQVAGKHLVGIQVIGIRIIPDAVHFPVFSCRNFNRGYFRDTAVYCRRS